MEHWFTVVIPTRQSATWIAALLQHYLKRGVVPKLLLDARTQDNTRQIAEGLGVQVVDVHDFTFTEAIVRRTQDVVSTPWALFMHDDELPSGKLFDRLEGPPPPAAAQSVAIPRRWAWYEPGKPLQYGRSDSWPDRAQQNGADHHWRLFQPGQVQYVAAMHSDGFYIDQWSRFPLDSYIVHFEWVVRTHAQRTAKLRRYDEYRYGYGRLFEQTYLPESQPPGLIEYLAFETDEFDELAKLYYSRRVQNAKIPPRSLRTRLQQSKNFIKDVLKLNDIMAEPEDRRGLNIRLEREISLDGRQ